MRLTRFSKAILGTGVALSVAVPCFAAGVATCTWCGPATGGNWTNAANWTIVRAGGSEALTDEEVMASYCDWNINTLADGAVITNTSATLKIGKIVFNAANRGTVILDDVEGANFKFNSLAEINVHPNNLLDFRLRQSNWDTVSDKRVVLNAGGSIASRRGTTAPRSRSTRTSRSAASTVASRSARFASKTAIACFSAAASNRARAWSTWPCRRAARAVSFWPAARTTTGRACWTTRATSISSAEP